MAFPTTATYPAAAEFSTVVFLWDGDSMNLGTNVGASHAMHTLVSAEALYSGKGRFENVAVGGRGADDVLAAFNNTKRFRTAPNAGYLFIWAGAADTNAATFTELQSYWALARADGWKVVAFTILPQADDTAPEADQKVAHNASILAASSEWDYCLDVASLLTNPNDTLYFSDGIHLTALGYQTVADWINDTLNLPVI